MYFSNSEFCQIPLQLADLTQLQFVELGVDFVLPLSQQQEETRLFTMRSKPDYVEFVLL